MPELSNVAACGEKRAAFSLSPFPALTLLRFQISNNGTSMCGPQRLGRFFETWKATPNDVFERSLPGLPKNRPNEQGFDKKASLSREGRHDITALSRAYRVLATMVRAGSRLSRCERHVSAVVHKLLWYDSNGSRCLIRSYCDTV